MSTNRILCLSMILLVLAGPLQSAFAQNQQKPVDLTDAQVTERLSYIENALYSAQPGAQAWWYTWISVYSSATIVTGTLAGLHWDDFDRLASTGNVVKVQKQDFAQDMLVSSCTFGIGVVGLLIFPFKPAYLPDKLRVMPSGTAGERSAKLQRAEEMLTICAQTEKDGWGWLTHTLNLAVNIGAGLVTIFAFDRPWQDGLITFATGEAISLVTIFSQPMRAVRDLKNYEAKYKSGEKAGAHEEYETEVFLTVVPGGIGVGMKF